MPCATNLKRFPALPLIPNKHTLILVSFSELMLLLLNYVVFIELHKKENFPHYSLQEIYHSTLGHGRHPFFKTAPPTIINYKNLLTISQVFQVKEAPKFKSDRNINKGIKTPYPLISAGGGGGALPHKRLMGMCRRIGSHFYDWIDYTGVAFSIQLLEWGRTFSDFWGKKVVHIYS